MTRRAGLDTLVEAFGYAAALMMVATTIERPGMRSYAAYCPTCRWESQDAPQQVSGRIFALEHIEFFGHPAYVIESDDGQ